MDNTIYQELIAAAKLARKKAYVPYSNFAVGAAILTEDDQIYTGCNVENASYGLSNCAERTAIFKAISERGEIKLKAIAVVGDTEGPCSPCGACRQVISEFGDDDLEIVMTNLEGDTLIKSISELLWGSFKLEEDTE
ncbi:MULTISPECIES: cytidine deaminase [unclassified Candidatus Frackibacter]|uniref:cytidine deaminase n=1 Tax=unclassified Candidatus Frackibacter TaxID=2648818 RepID=UPI00088A3EDC|nr:MULTISPECIES: cytidine deaminase [unclassified Candidatus Frackibacter]SDC74136.1 cytidine deaminase [Candidatus Frackibacter sp. WG11]SEM88162.1 cytidine deaminase [Candidatus Frackibacter sp. WG12]SFL97552.1 cytidine deaminase [Candidatus Frackibacter sp. WG13]